MEKTTGITLKNDLKKLITSHKKVHQNLSRKETIKHVLDNKEAIASKNGAIATWTPTESTGRSPKDTYIVKRAESEKNIDWTSPNNLPIDSETFDMLFADALQMLSQKEQLYTTDRVIGADSKYALPVKVVTNLALTTLFTDNMFSRIT